LPVVASVQQLITPSTAQDLLACLHAAAPGQDWPALTGCTAGFDDLGLSQRTRAISDALLADLPPAYPATGTLISAALRQEAFTGWMIWPVSEAVARRALESGRTSDFDRGMALIARLTPRLTSEFALRYFLAADLDRALAIAGPWTAHRDWRVRRLASEGTRPRLPWARQVPALFAHPTATVAILDALYQDPSDDVRRSVANHLNDLSRDNPDVALAAATRWLAAPGPDEATAGRTAALVRHGMRTLIKRCDPQALRLLGFGGTGPITVTGPTLRGTRARIGDEIVFDASVRNDGRDDARVAVDYVVHYAKANGSRAPKVFKLATKTLAPGQSVTLSRRHSFRPMTTRRHHPGVHALELQVNGRRHGLVEFTIDAQLPA
jgi:3-methyladenine DNA glycosylase AlkC